MRILFTHPPLCRPGGVPTFTRQLALGLVKLGHEARGFEAFGEEKREPAVADLPLARGTDDFQPDILHLQHCLPAYAALLAFPSVPAIFHCHGGTWRDTAFKHPRVRHYLVMSGFQAERLSIEWGVPREKITVYHNPVNTFRFLPEPPIGQRAPSLLLYHGRLAADDPLVFTIQEVAGRRGLRADFFGHGFGTSVIAPEKLLPNYPIVFASGISAIEAMACGCAVILVGRAGCGEMVSSENFDRLRARNFSMPMNCPQVTPEAVVRAIDSFDPQDAAKVTERLRREADLLPAAEEMVRLYQSVMAETSRPVDAWKEECAATAGFLRWLAPMVAARDQSGANQSRAGENWP